MSNRASIKTIVKGVSDRMAAIAARATKSEQFFLRVVRPAYLTAQKERWKTENNTPYTDGEAWPALDPKYAERKKRDFAEYPGSGRLMMIATGRLSNSILAASKEFKEVTTQRSIAWATTVPYAKFPNEARTFTKFSRKFYTDLGGFYREYVLRGSL